MCFDDAANFFFCFSFNKVKGWLLFSACQNKDLDIQCKVNKTIQKNENVSYDHRKQEFFWLSCVLKMLIKQRSSQPKNKIICKVGAKQCLVWSKMQIDMLLLLTIVYHLSQVLFFGPSSSSYLNSICFFSGHYEFNFLLVIRQSNKDRICNLNCSFFKKGFLCV